MGQHAAGSLALASPWLLGSANTTAMHFSIGLGATVALLTALELWLFHDAAHPEPPRHGAQAKKQG